MSDTTNFPRVFPVTQVRAIAEHFTGALKATPDNWIENLRHASFALGTVATHSRGIIGKLRERLAEQARELTDEQLGQAVLELTNNQQGILRGSMGVITPELIVLIFEMLMRFFREHHEDLGAIFATTQEVSDDDVMSSLAGDAQPVDESDEGGEAPVG